MIKKLKEELHKLESKLKFVEKELSKSKSGKLKCIVNHGSYQYYIDDKYIRKDKRQEAKLLAQRDYYKLLKKRIEAQLQTINKLLPEIEKNSLVQVYEDLPKGKQALVTPAVKSMKDLIDEFVNIEYKGKEFSEDDTSSFYTMNNERVRSKSEVIIANELFKRGIPYHYEMPLTVWQRNREIVIHPDFTVLSLSTGKRWIIEHLGMMDKYNYSDNAMNRWSLYEKNGYILGENLLLTHESSYDPLDTEVLRGYLDKYMIQ